MTDEKFTEIDALVKNGDVAEAASRLSAVLAEDPADDVARMLYGTCAQLLGNEAEFGRVHVELQAKMDAVAASGEQSRRTALWEKYKALAGKLAFPCALVASSVILCGCYGCPPMDPEYRDARDARVSPAAAPNPGTPDQASSPGGAQAQAQPSGDAPASGGQEQEGRKDPAPAP